MQRTPSLPPPRVTPPPAAPILGVQWLTPSMTTQATASSTPLPTARAPLSLWLCCWRLGQSTPTPMLCSCPQAQSSLLQVYSTSLTTPCAAPAYNLASLSSCCTHFACVAQGYQLMLQCPDRTKHAEHVQMNEKLTLHWLYSVKHGCSVLCCHTK